MCSALRLLTLITSLVPWLLHVTQAKSIFNRKTWKSNQTRNLWFIFLMNTVRYPRDVLFGVPRMTLSYATPHRGSPPKSVQIQYRTSAIKTLRKRQMKMKAYTRGFHLSYEGMQKACKQGNIKIHLLCRARTGYLASRSKPHHTTCLVMNTCADTLAPEYD